MAGSAIWSLRCLRSLTTSVDAIQDEDEGGEQSPHIRRCQQPAVSRRKSTREEKAGCGGHT